ncbi:unnamed protein product [Pylaiella littoralis]
MLAQGTLWRGRPQLLLSARAMPRSTRPSGTTPPAPATVSDSTAAAAGRRKGKGLANLLPHHLSPRWNEKRDISVFGSHVCWMSLSEAAGHLSFVFLGMGFLETELLPLRVYAAAGVSASIAFQYYRPQPLWIPISWNFFFLAINVGMVGLILKERSDAEQQQDGDTAAIYDTTFRESGLTAVDFMKVMSISEDERHAAGDALAEQDVTQEKLHLLVEGELLVSKAGNDIATVRAGEFAGEMSFLRHVRRECDGPPAGAPAVCNCAAVANVNVKTGGARVISWRFDELRHLLATNPNMSVCFHAALAKAMASKLVDTHDPAVKYRQLLTGVLVDGIVTATEKDGLAEMRRGMNVDEAVHAAGLKAAGWTTQEFDQGYPNELSNRTYEALAREVLQDGSVSDKGRTKLRIHRQKNGIDSLHHMHVLEKLGWSLDQLEEGTLGDCPSFSVTPPVAPTAGSDAEPPPPPPTDNKVPD